jgi:biopolymer transport protein ExbD
MAVRRYKYVVDVVDNVRAAGVDQLGLLTEQKKNTIGGPPPAGQ